MSYTEELREAVLATYSERGPAAAAREHGVPVRTVKRWAHNAGIGLGDALKSATANACAANVLTRSEVAARWCDVGSKLLDRVQSNLATMPAGDVKNLVTAAAICSDKFVALAPPENDPTRLTVTEADRQRVEENIAELIAAEAERITRESAGDYPEDDAAD